MNDLRNILELAETAHKEEVRRDSKLKGFRHVPTSCTTCMDIAYGFAKMDEAERVFSDVVLYIP